MQEDKLTTKEKAEITIQAGLNAIPYIGGSLATIYFGAKQERRFKRIEVYYHQLMIDFEKHKNDVKPLDAQDKNKLAALIEGINENIENDIAEQKIEYFKNCFFNTLIKPRDEDFGKRKYFIDTLGKLTQIDIEILVNLYKAEKGAHYKPNFDSSDSHMSEFNASLEKLKSYGLLNSQLSGTLQPGINWASITVYTLSEFGIDFSDFCLEIQVQQNIV